MTFTEKFEAERTQIIEALGKAGIETILLTVDIVPKSFPAAILTLRQETGTHATARQFRDSDLGWTVFLVVDATPAVHQDPDADLYALKESFRKHYIELANNDFPRVEYYPANADARKVRIARIETGKASA